MKYSACCILSSVVFRPIKNIHKTNGQVSSLSFSVEQEFLSANTFYVMYITRMIHSLIQSSLHVYTDVLTVHSVGQDTCNLQVLSNSMGSFSKKDIFVLLLVFGSKKHYEKLSIAFQQVLKHLF